MAESPVDPLTQRFHEAREEELAQLLELIERELVARGWTPKRVWSKPQVVQRPQP